MTEVATSALMGAVRNNTFSIDEQVMAWLAEARTRMPTLYRSVADLDGIPDP